MKQFAEGAEAGEVIEAAERRLFGLRLEVIEAPLLKIETAVDRDGKVAAVGCRAALDLGIDRRRDSTATSAKLSAGTAPGTAAAQTAAHATTQVSNPTHSTVKNGVLFPPHHSFVSLVRRRMAP